VALFQALSMSDTAITTKSRKYLVGDTSPQFAPLAVKKAKLKCGELVNAAPVSKK